MPLDESTELTLYRISQEALRNVTKHSRARRVTLELSRDSSGLRLRIFDDGVGFDSGRMIQGKGLGLTSMKERLAVIGGSLSIQSAPGKGTDLEIRIPAQAAAGPS
jgi:signal transduction histidine kinase